MLFLFAAFVISLSVRILSISSFPFLVSPADGGTWVAFAREITANGFSIPSVNTIHYPGSPWIYPPAIPYAIAVVSAVTGSSGFTLFYVVSAFETVFQSLIIFPLYFTVRKVWGTGSAAVSVVMFTGFPPLLYLLTWSAVTQVSGFLMLALVLFLFSDTFMESGRVRRNTISAIAISFALVFVHDLTAFVFIFATLASTLYYVLKNHGSGTAAAARMIRISLASFLSSAAGFVIWYIPRLSWLSETGSISVTHGSLSSVYEFVTVDLLNLSQPLAVPHFIYYLSFLLLPVSAYFIYLNIRSRQEKIQNPVTVFSVSALAVTLLSIPFPVIFARLAYFLALMYLFFVPAQLVRLLSSRLSTKSEKRNYRKYRQAAGILVAVFIILYSVWGMAFAYSAHSYYVNGSSENGSETVAAVQWISANVNSTSVVAANSYTGFLIMGFSGNPVIDGQNLSYVTQYSEANQSRAATVLVDSPLSNISLTQRLIGEYNVSVVVTSLDGSHVPSFYTYAYGGPSVFVYFVS